nr:pre-mRNA-splicing factor cwc25-like [Lolium perenne]
MGLLDGTDAAPPKTEEIEDSDKQVPSRAYAIWHAQDQALMSYLVKSLYSDLLAQAFDDRQTMLSQSGQSSVVFQSSANTKSRDAGTLQLRDDRDRRDNRSDYRRDDMQYRDDRYGGGGGYYYRSDDKDGGGYQRRDDRQYRDRRDDYRDRRDDYNRRDRRDDRDMQRRNEGGRGGGGAPRGGRGRGRTPTRFVDTTCQICTKYGHPTKDCWWRYSDRGDDDEDNSRTEKGSYGVDTNWYMDSGATDHITGQLNKLHTSEDYKGRDQVHNASGTERHDWRGNSGKSTNVVIGVDTEMKVVGSQGLPPR